jgi:hypothetical protein
MMTGYLFSFIQYMRLQPGSHAEQASRGFAE